MEKLSKMLEKAAEELEAKLAIDIRSLWRAFLVYSRSLRRAFIKLEESFHEAIYMKQLT